MIRYVSMTDNLMTWWIKADDGREAVLVFFCYSAMAADIVVRNAELRGDMSNITVHTMPPVFSQTVRVTSLNHNDCPKWYYRNSVKTMED